MPTGKPELRVHPAEFWMGVEAIEKLYRQKICIAGARGDCDGNIVQAHTIPRSQLQKIAVDGHIYGFRATARDLYKNEGQYVVEKQGIGQFSILNFFCAEHDRVIFLHLENDELLFDAHQHGL